MMRDAGLESGRQTTALIEPLTRIREEMIASVDQARSLLASVASEQRDSAENLLHYLALRRHDVRALQLRLAARGLSSLGRAESHVLATLDAVLDTLCASEGCTRPEVATAALTFERGQQLLQQH